MLIAHTTKSNSVAGASAADRTSAGGLLDACVAADTDSTFRPAEGPRQAARSQRTGRRARGPAHRAGPRRRARYRARIAPEPLVHQLRPAAGEPAGALILLHGRGADEYDLLSVLDALDPEQRLIGVTPGAPLAGPGGGRWWYHVPRVGFPDPTTLQATYAQLTAFLDGWLAEQDLGWERTIIGGFSMGCVMSYATGLGPGRPSPAGILAMSGFIPTVEGWEPELESRRDLPVLITHGANDPVISVEFARDARGMLLDAGVDVDYHEHDGGHHLDRGTVSLMQGWVGARVAAFAP